MIPRMNREEFFQAVVDQIRSVLPEEFQEANVRIEKVLKEGDQVYTGLIVQLPGENNYPRIYIDQEFSEYLAGRDFDGRDAGSADLPAGERGEQRHNSGGPAPYRYG